MGKEGSEMYLQTIVFDLDGTLLDSLPGLLHSTNAALARCGYPLRTYDEVRAFVGNGIGKLIERALPGGLENPDYAACMEAFRADYRSAMFTGSKPYPGILELLDALGREGCRLAVVSNKIDSAVQALNGHFFGRRIAVAVGERPGMARKPAPDGVNAALRALRMPRETAAYVGDSEVDLQTARSAGLPCFSVDWGNRSARELAENGAFSISHTPQELLAALCAWQDPEET